MDRHVFGLAFGGFFTVFGLIFTVIVVIIGRQLWTSWRTYRTNKSSPVQSFPVKVVAKRDQTSGGGRNSSARTTYFVTFERLDLQRLELTVTGEQFGMLAEGDQGQLAHQGSWFVSFDRSLA